MTLKSNIQFKQIILLPILLFSINVFSQAPNIKYASAANALSVGTAFSITPTNSGGAVPATTYGQVSTLAGNLAQTSGYVNATGTAAMFNTPELLTGDANGNLYVADLNNNAIRKVTPAGAVTTYAGSLTGASGYKDTTVATAALFYRPTGVVLDASGNLFVADRGNDAIREITPAGVVSTFYHSTGMGPSGLCFDASGNLIVAARSLSQILKITPSGVATIVAGNWYGYSNGTGTAAHFENPTDVKVDASGNIFVADYLDNAIRQITPAGVVTTFAGSAVSGNAGAFLDSVGTAAKFNNPTGLAITSGGVIYVADFVNHGIRRIMPDGTVTLVAGSPTQVYGNTDATGTAATFHSPFGIFIDASGTAYVTNMWSSVRKLVLTGYTLKGTLPAGLTFDSTTGTISGTPTAYFSPKIYTVTAYNATGYSSTTITLGMAPTISYGSSQSYTYSPGTAISALTPTVTGNPVPYTGYTTTFAGSGASGITNGIGTVASFALPDGLTVDSKGNVYVTDILNASDIRKITPLAVVSTLAGSSTSGFTNGIGAAASFRHPVGLITDTAGNVYVADESNNAIRKITPAGVVTTLAGGTQGSADGTGTAAQFYLPTGITIDASGNLFVADYWNSKIRKITPDGTVSTFAGGTQGYADGLGTAAQFNHPNSIAIDASGNLYVLDRGNQRVRKITPAGLVTTVAGNGTAGFADGPASSAMFNNPGDLDVDALGNIYVSDFGNYRVRKISPDGVVSTLAGTGAAGSNNGIGSGATFGGTYGSPAGMAFDGSGSLFVADYPSNLIRKTVTTPYTISPTLPAGLSFDPQTGIISGTPTSVTASTTYTVTAYNMVGATSTILTIGVGTGTVNPSQNQNYIITYVPEVSGKTTATAVVAASGDKTQVQTNIQYFDGLGRPSQTVQVKGTPGGMDLVQPAAYDQFGRAAVKYLPYAASTDDGSYKTDALTTGAGLFKFYNPSGSTTITQQSNGIVNTSFPYAVSGFEPSPLNRVVEQGAPGADWQLPGTGDANSTGHTARTIYTFNNYIPSSDTANSMLVMIYTATINNDQSRTLFNNNGATYQANLLSVTISRDENWQSGRGGTTETYKDKSGRVILKRTFNYTGGTLQELSTYYVYDDFGNLAFVLPPLSNPDNGTPSQTTLDNLCYQYRYDDNGRLTQKKIPGKDWEYTVYNQLNQPVLTQDGNQRVNNQWTVTKYDALGRVIMTGLWNAGSNIPLATLQASVYAGVQWDARDYTNNTTGYNVISYPALSKTLTINYYDDYTNIPALPSAYTTGPTGYSTMTKGLPTVTKTTVLNTLNNATPDMLWAVNFYDNLGRDIQTYKQHYLAGALSPYNYDLLTNTYNFINQPTAILRQHYIKNSGNTAAVLAVTISTSYDYDHMGRKTNSWEQINTDNKILLAQSVYNEIGQLGTKKLHSENSGTSFLQAVNYNYNERGWLLSGLSSGNTFNFNLYYNLPDAGISKQYNGNIAEMLYTKTGAGKVTFQYAYDQLNRLNSAVSTGNTLNETISYDLNGNIMSLARTGNNAATLSYSYYNSNQSNQLQTVTNGGAAFRSYSYDPNGNATTDGGSKAITYNLLDLPQTVTQNSTTLATYIYDATGDKLRNTGSDGSWDYISGIVYNNNAISFIQTEEGRASLQGTAYHYEYNLKDNLGNVRYSFDKDPSTGNARRIQEDEYYSFGLRETPVVYDYSNNNRYLYNGKEVQTDLTSQYDYGARFYDPVIGRWTTIDPKAEKAYSITPFRYGFNNPIRIVDPNGDYEEDGHFWTAWLMLTMMHNQNAYQIAYWTEAPDWIMNEAGDKVRETRTWLKPVWQRDVHALTGLSSATATDLAYGKIRYKGTLSDLGFGIHYMGDSFAHRQMTDEDVMYPGLIGHGLENYLNSESQKPDNISSRPNLYRIYVRNLAKALGAQNLDMFTFDYVANKKGSTDQNDAIFETEIRILQGAKNYDVAGDYRLAIGNYISASNMHYNRQVHFQTSIYQETHLKQNSDGEWVPDYTETRTQVIIQ